MTSDMGMAGKQGVSYTCTGGKTLMSMYDPTGLGVAFDYDGKSYKLPEYKRSSDGYQYVGYSNEAMIDYMIDNDLNVSSLKLNGMEQGPCVGMWHGTTMSTM